MINIVTIIIVIARLYETVVIIHILLSWIIRDPYHPVRQSVDRFVQPLLDPIRRIMPSMGMFDFSPVVLLVLIQIVINVLVGLV